MLPSPKACFLLLHELLLLLLAGDVEPNPGPMTKAQGDMLASIYEVVQRLEASQSALVEQVKQLTDQLNNTDATVVSLSNRVSSMEKDFTALKSRLGSDKQSIPALQSLNHLEARCDDAESRSRRSNLLFFGFPDTANETWAESEKAVIDMCSDKLDVSIDTLSIDRAHRIGVFRPDRKRPIIVKFCFFKHKQQILSASPKLKGTSHAISEDFSPHVRHARRKLLAFGKAQDLHYRLRFDKLYIGDKCYVYDSVGDCIRES